jgi:hypothetical protein
MTTQQINQLNSIIDQLGDLRVTVSNSEWAYIMDATVMLEDLRDAAVAGTVEEELDKLFEAQLPNYEPEL